ncbi:MAG TPA: DUF892 family protein, partial [Solirubrobacteraceae bacterium]|nr:DUF892 family protein [Solirubrobacteraceae bacterium]
PPPDRPGQGRWLAVVASYRLLRRLAERAGDAETVSVTERILEQEEAMAELVAGTFDRELETALGEPGRSPLTPVTPLGKPSGRPSQARGARRRSRRAPPGRRGSRVARWGGRAREPRRSRRWPPWRSWPLRPARSRTPCTTGRRARPR